jgi:hypothetical protein
MAALSRVLVGPTSSESWYSSTQYPKAQAINYSPVLLLFYFGPLRFRLFRLLFS